MEIIQTVKIFTFNQPSDYRTEKLCLGFHTEPVDVITNTAAVTSDGLAWTSGLSYSSVTMWFKQSVSRKSLKLMKMLTSSCEFRNTLEFLKVTLWTTFEPLLGRFFFFKDHIIDSPDLAA